MPTHSIPAHRLWLTRSRSWIGLTLAAPFLALALVSHPLVMEGSWRDFEFDTLAWVVFTFGAMLRWWATLYLGDRKTKTVVQDGPYSLCRNPIYLGTLCMGISVAIFLKSLTFGAGFMFAGLLYLTITVPTEEQRLREKFGADFDDYCRRVPRFLPRFSSFRTDQMIQVSTKGLWAEGLRALRWIWIPVGCELLQHLRGESWWPHVLTLP